MLVGDGCDSNKWWTCSSPTCTCSCIQHTHADMTPERRPNLFIDQSINLAKLRCARDDGRPTPLAALSFPSCIMYICSIRLLNDILLLSYLQSPRSYGPATLPSDANRDGRLVTGPWEQSSERAILEGKKSRFDMHHFCKVGPQVPRSQSASWSQSCAPSSHHDEIYSFRSSVGSLETNACLTTPQVRPALSRSHYTSCCSNLLARTLASGARCMIHPL
jgi:hypothetical protein